MIRAIRYLAILLALGIPAASEAQFTFATNNGALTITHYSGTVSSVVIPATTNGLPVTAIGAYAFENAGLTSITIPASVTSIGDFAFYGCLYLPSVSLSANVTNISGTAFSFCYSMTNFAVDSGNPTYSSAAGVLFDKAQTLLVQFPANSATASYAIPATVTSIGPSAFETCHVLTSVTIPNGVTNIGMGAFLGCIYLTGVVIPNSVVTVGDSAFDACSQMTNAVIGTKVTYLGADVFDNCSALAYTLTIPDSVKTIGANAFVDCGLLPSVSIGTGVTNIGLNAFEFCADLTNITVSPSNPDYSSANGVLFDKTELTLIQFPIGATANYVVPTSVTSIESYAFQEATKLFGITFDAALTNIGDYAFDGCVNLSQVIVPDNVTAIGGEAFEGCVTLNTVSFGAHLGSIGVGSFYGCIVLPTVNIPATLTNIGIQAFESCSSLASFTVDPANPTYASANGVLFNRGQNVLIQFPSGIYGSYAIPTNVTSIGSYAFLGCNLTGVTIPSTVTNIGSFAFYNVPLTTIVIPNSVTTIGGEAFTRTGLTNVTIPNSVTSIADDAFEYCAGLTNVVIGSGVTNLGNDVFYGCNNLISANFLGNAPTNNGTAFYEDSGVTVYYQAGTTGWGSTFGGAPAAQIGTVQVTAQIQSDGFVGGQFVLNITGTTNSVVEIQASIDLTNWTSVGTNTLANGAGTFQDGQSTNHPIRFYRLKY